MRLDKFIAQVHGCSRKEARRLILRRHVAVDGQIEIDGGRVLSAGAAVTLDGEPLCDSGPVYWMVHKPAGYVCANRDARHPVVVSLLPQIARGIHVAGRLDRDVTGLVLLTNDGSWSHRITSPRMGCRKVYRVQTDVPLPDDAEQRCAEGIWLINDQRRTLPAQLQRLSECACLLTLQEGRHHQVKRMMASLGCRVQTLHREAIGTLRLDIEEGWVRTLSAAEVASLASPDELSGLR